MSNLIHRSMISKSNLPQFTAQYVSLRYPVYLSPVDFKLLPLVLQYATTLEASYEASEVSGWLGALSSGEMLDKDSLSGVISWFKKVIFVLEYRNCNDLPVSLSGKLTASDWAEFNFSYHHYNGDLEEIGGALDSIPCPDYAVYWYYVKKLSDILGVVDKD